MNLDQKISIKGILARKTAIGVLPKLKNAEAIMFMKIAYGISPLDHGKVK